MKKKILLLLVFSVCLSYSQDATGIDYNNNSFRIKVKSSYEKFSDEQKGNFIIRDYFEFSDPSKTGTFKLPYQNIILAIPQNSKPEFKVISKTEKKLKNIIPKLNPSAELLSDSSIQNIETPVSGRVKNDAPIFEVINYFWYRNNYCVNLRVNTYSFDEAASSLIAYDDIEIEVKLPSGFALQKPQENINAMQDNALNSLIYNSSLAGQFKGSRQLIADDTTGSWINYNAQYLKLGTVNNSLFRIYKADLNSIGISTGGLNPQTFRMFNKGKEVPVRVTGQEDGSFDDSDFIEFWGTKNYSEKSHRIINSSNEEYNEYLNRYSDTSFYFLTWGQQNGTRIITDADFNSSLSDTLNYYTAFEHLENNTMYQNCSNDEVANQTPGWVKNKTWYWQFIYGGQTQNYTFPVSNPYPGKRAEIYFKIVSAGSNLTQNAHNLALKFGGAAIDSQTINRFSQALLHGSLNSSSLAAGNNTFSIQNYLNGTVNFLAIDWADVEYPRYLRASNDSLFFSFKENFNNTPALIKISNVSSADVVLYKVKPDVKMITGFQIINGDLFFTDTLNTGNEYYLIRQPGILKPMLYYSRQFVNLRSASNSADYLAITHEKFSTAVDQYVNYVDENYNVNAKKIFVNDIFDEFSYGYPYPQSIKEFLKSAMDNWQSPKPVYVCLIGDADYDYKGYLYKISGVRLGENYVPSYAVPVSDSWFTAFDESFPVPQMQIGRIPINKSEELQYYIDKSLNNINAPFDDWNKRYIFFSGGGNANEFADLRAANEIVIEDNISQKPISGNYTHFYKTASPLSDFGPYTPEHIRETISQGSVFISYIGHSGTATWDNSINNAIQLKNNVNRNPLITDFGCSTAKFAEPDIICFGERFLLGSDGQAIMYVGNSSLGFTNSALAVPDLFYKYLTGDSLHQVGTSHIKAKEELLTRYGNSSVNRVFALTNSLLGDPLTRLKIPNYPNFKIGSEDILISSQVNSTEDSVSFRLVINNLGLALSDSITINIGHFSVDSLLEESAYRIMMPERSDTLSLWLHTKRLAGQHRLTINIDAENEIDEIYEDDNLIDYQFPVYSSSLRDLLAYNMENGAVDKLYLLNPAAYLNDSFPVIFQISEDEDFTTFNETTTVSDTFYTEINPENLQPSKRYWFRYKIGDSESEFGNPKSFYTSDSSAFLLADSVSFSSQELSHISYKDNGVSLSTDSITYSVLSAGANSGATCVIARNGINMLSNSFFAGFGIAVLDEHTFEPDTVTWFQTWNNAVQVKALTDLINSIEPDKIVLMGVSDDATNGMDRNLMNAIKSVGSSKIDSLQFQGSWALIGRKGAASNEVIEEVRGKFDGSIYSDSTFTVPSLEGEFVTKLIGPSGKWEQLKINNALAAGSEINYKVIGVSDESPGDSLFTISSSDSLTDLSIISAEEYPYIKISSQLKAGELGVSPSVNLIGVDYQSIPELGLNYQVVSTPDSVYQGNEASLGFSIYNVGELPADSFNIRVDVNGPDGLTKNIMDSAAVNLGGSEKKDFNVSYITNSTDGKGNFAFSIKIDPANKIREIFKDNNNFEAPFYIKPDTITTSVTDGSISALFNGKEIIDGDFILPNPEITITLDYPSWFPVNDTTALEFYLDQQKLSFLDIYSDHDSADRELIFSYKPLLADGEHTLRIFGVNADGTMEDAPGFEKTFMVSNEAQLLNVYNYPNPFMEDTYFTFTLTQIPDELKIKIYTIAGRLIKEINKTFSELDVNFNKIPWDGKDEDGDQVANGVYLYKVIMKKGNETLNVTEKLARVR